MTVREFKIKCPMCEGIVIIDALNGKIVRHFEPDHRKEDEKPDPAQFDAALDKVAKGQKEGDSTFSDALKKVSEKKTEAEDFLKEIQKKAEEMEDERPEDKRDFWD